MFAVLEAISADDLKSSHVADALLFFSRLGISPISFYSVDIFIQAKIAVAPEWCGALIGVTEIVGNMNEITDVYNTSLCI